MVYQKYELNHDKISVFDHTRVKSTIVIEIIKKFNLINVTDCGCAEGALLSYIKQEIPHINATAYNLSNDEIDRNIKNIKFAIGNIFNINEENDCCLLFAVIHHMLGQVKNKDLVMKKLIFLIQKFGIIEVPLENDALLKMWIDKNTENPDLYSVLSNKQKFIEWIEPYFEIIEEHIIDYNNSKDLNRIAFVIKKK